MKLKVLFRFILLVFGIRRLLAGRTDLPASRHLDLIQDRFDQIERILGVHR